MTDKQVHPKIVKLGEAVSAWYLGDTYRSQNEIVKIEGERISDILFVCKVHYKDNRMLFIGPVLIKPNKTRLPVECYNGTQCVNTTSAPPYVWSDFDFTDVFNNNEETKKMITLKLNNIEVNFEELRDTGNTFKEGIILALGMLDAKAGLITSGITTTEFYIDGTRGVIHFRGDQAFAWTYHTTVNDEYLGALQADFIKLAPQIKEVLKELGNPVEHLGLAVVTDDLKDHIFEAASAIYSTLNGKVNQIPGMNTCW